MKVQLGVWEKMVKDADICGDARLDPSRSHKLVMV